MTTESFIYNLDSKLIAMNLRQLSNRINLLKYISKTFKSIESISINRRSNLIHSLQNLKNGLFHLVTLLPKNSIRTSSKRKNAAIVVIASDSSLCGAYNSQIINYCENQLSSQIREKLLESTGIIEDISKKDVKIFIVGKKIRKLEEYFKQFPNVITEFYTLKDICEGKLDSSKLFKDYGWDLELVSTGKDKVESCKLHSYLSEIRSKSRSEPQGINDFFIEENPRELYKYIEDLLFHYCFFYKIYKAQIQETISRLYFLKNSLDNCEEEIQVDTQQYRRMRQEAITQEINEIISSSI